MGQYSLDLTLLPDISMCDYDICNNFELPEQCEICYKVQNGKLINILAADIRGKTAYEILDYFPTIKDYRLIEESLNLCLMCIKQLILSYLFFIKLEESNKKFKGLVKLSAKVLNLEYTKIADHDAQDPAVIDGVTQKESESVFTSIETDTDGYDVNIAEHINSNNEYVSANLEEESDNENRDDIEPKFEKYVNEVQECEEIDNKNLTEKIEILVETSNNSQGNKYICDTCGMVFTKKQSLEKHIRRIHLQEKSFQCSTCGKLFFLEGVYKRHLLLHSETFSYTCDLCGKGFVTNGVLKSHVNTVHMEKNLTCSSCDKLFKLPIQLKRHIAKVHNLSPEDNADANLKKAKCKICCKYFNKYVLKSHMERHSEIRRHKCDICGQEFFQLPSLNNHMIRHQDPKFTCNYCNKQFFTKQEMLTHVRRHHTREIVCTCQHCGKGFVHRSNLTQHIRNCHSNDSEEKNVEPKVPKQCNECGKIYSSRTSLFHHRKRTHENKQYPCTKCDMTFRNLVPLKSHLKKVHDIGETHQCDICDKHYSTKEDLYKHKKRTHNIGRNSLYLCCTLCKMKFKIKHELIQHIQNEHLQKIDASVMPLLYECNVCVTFFLDFNMFHTHVFEHPVKPTNKFVVREYISWGCRIQSFTGQKKCKNSPAYKDISEIVLNIKSKADTIG